MNESNTPERLLLPLEEPPGPTIPLYSRGFLLSGRQIGPPVSGWREAQTAGRWLYHDPNVDLSFGHTDTSAVYLLGRATLLGSVDHSDVPVAQRLANKLALSRDLFDEEVELLCGNYALIIRDGTRTSIQSDAGGLRSVFYSPRDQLVGSHARLVATFCDSADYSEFYDASWEIPNSVSYLPGVRTIFREVLQLSPNTELQIDSMTLRRVFPRRPPLSLEVPEVVERVEPLLLSQLPFLTDTGKDLMLSLTAGIDSRTSLALMRPVIDQVTALTYVLGFGRYAGMRIMEVDEDIAREITSTFSIQHRMALIPDSEVRPSVKKVLQANTHHEHIWPLAQWYLDNISPDTLHVRSNLFEIGRAFYRKGHTRKMPLTPERMAETHRRSSSGRPAAVEAFREYVDVTDFDSLMGHDPYDFFYWEHRVGRWHGNVVAESDISHETWVLINSRRVLELFLAASLSKRIDATVYRELMARRWPALIQWPWNTTRFERPPRYG